MLQTKLALQKQQACSVPWGGAGGMGRVASDRRAGRERTDWKEARDVGDRACSHVASALRGGACAAAPDGDTTSKTDTEVPAHTRSASVISVRIISSS